MTFRYIGSKARLSEPLREVIGNPESRSGRFIDAFSGTGAVAAIAAEMGWPVHLNDALPSAIVMSTARLICADEAEFQLLGGYGAVLRSLNELEGSDGYFRRTYSPASRHFDDEGIERRYLTEDNAGRLDAIRTQIAIWKSDGKISDDEQCVLLADLISAVNRVANIAGTYGCYLSRWQANAERRLELTPRALRDMPVDRMATIGNAENLSVRSEDVVYLDPPYTKRQYASYYHILDSIVLADEPVVGGVSGLRPWHSKASAFCYKRRAFDAIVDLIQGLGAHRILLSYSSEGHVAMDDLLPALADRGEMQIHSYDGVSRYRPNTTARDRGDAVTEFIIDLRPATSQAKASTIIASREEQYA